MSTDIFTVRRRNLRALIQQWDGAGNLARKLGHASASYLSQLTGPHPSRQVTEKVARGVEVALGLPLGWLDTNHKGTGQTVNDQKVQDAIHLVGQVLEEMGTTATPPQFAELVALLYERGGLDEQYLRRLINLMRK